MADENHSIDYFVRLLEKAYAKRIPLMDLTDAFRIVNGADDGFPGVAVDKYAEHFQIQYFGPDLLGQKEAIAAAVRKFLEPQFLVSKFRLSSSGESLEKPQMQVESGETADSATVVREGNCLFKVDLLDTVNPGLFLDMRDGRLDVEKRSRGKNILNLFSYTCSFSVHARVGGALRAVNADISVKILDKGRENYRLNGIDPQKGEFFKGDSREYLDWCVRKGLRFDGVILDPPSFSRNRGKVFSVKTDFQKLVAEVAEVLAPGAFFLASSNFSGFSLESFSKETWRTVRQKFPSAKIAWCRGQGCDFPGSGTRKESSLSAVMIEV